MILDFNHTIAELNSQYDIIFANLKSANFQLSLILHAIFYFMLGIGITLLIRWFVGKIIEKNVSAHYSLLFRRIILYTGLIISLFIPINTSGLDVKGILGAAGIIATVFTAGLAFAAQTSLSNFLSGIFLVAEKPFVLGDYVRINDTLGEVLSIDLLSVKLRTRDNILVRIPNETLLKAQFQNVSRFPIRRFDIPLRVNFDEDLEKINHVLMETAKKNPLCLVSPHPELTFVEFGDSAILLRFSIWGKQASYTLLQTNILLEIQMAFKAAEIHLPITYNPPVLSAH